MSPVGQMLNQLNYANKARTKEDAKKALEVYRSLLPKIATHVNNAGIQSRLLVLTGTVPIKYQGVQYNIPVEIFLPERYPEQPPKVYVRPTPNMTIKANHKHVDTQGVVYLPYLHEWNSNTSNITGLVAMCSSVFSIEPPLFSRPAAAAATATATVAATPTPVSATASAYGKTAYGTITSATSNTTAASYVNRPQTTPTPAVMQPSVSSSAASSNHAALVERADLALQSMLYTQHRALHAELTTQFSLSQSLDDSQRRAEAHLAALREKVVGLEKALAETQAKTQDARAWRECERARRAQAMESSTSSSDEGVSVAEREERARCERMLAACVRAGDAVSTQMVRLQSESDAVDDALYHLERALLHNHGDKDVNGNGERGLDLNAFLREVRALSRRQFLCRAHLAKIQHTIQHTLEQQQVAGTSQFGFVAT